MGAGASTPNLRKQLDVEALKPADVNDITTLPEAKAELRRLRSQLKALKDTVRLEHRGGEGSTGLPRGRLTTGWRRDACCDRGGLEGVRCCRRLAVCACSTRPPPYATPLQRSLSTHPGCLCAIHTRTYTRTACSAVLRCLCDRGRAGYLSRTPNIDLTYPPLNTNTPSFVSVRSGVIRLPSVSLHPNSLRSLHSVAGQRPGVLFFLPEDVAAAREPFS
jgi:hypothetical protein